MDELRIYPTHAHVAADLARAAGESAGGLVMGQPAMTLRDLESTLARAACPSLRVLPPYDERRLLRRVAEAEVVRKGRFGEIAETRGFVNALSSTLGACRRAGVDGVALRQAAHGDESIRGERLRALAEIIEDFDARCAAVGAVDAGLVPFAVSAALDAGQPLPPSVAEAQRIVIRHVHELPPSRVRLLESLARRMAPRGEVTLLLPHEDGPSWFALTQTLLSHFERSGSVAMSVVPVSPLEGEGVGAALGRALVERGSGTLGESAEVHVMHSPDPLSEHRNVARHVRGWIDQGVPPERIVIAARALDRHIGGLTDALLERGVPVQERRGTAASLAPPIRWLMAVAEAAQAGAERDALLPLLLSGYAVELRRGFGLDRGTISRVLKRVGGRSSLTDPHGGVLTSLGRLTEDPDSPEGTERVRDLIERFRELSMPLASAVTLREAVGRVRAFAKDSGLLDATRRVEGGVDELRRLIAHQDDDVSSAEAHAIGRDRAALESLEVALEALLLSARHLGDEEPLPPASFIAILDDALSEQEVPGQGIRGGAVRILALRDLGGLDVDAVAMVGLTDGEVPAGAPHDPLLTAHDRALVARTIDAERRLWSFDVASEGPLDAPLFTIAQDEEPLIFLLGLSAAKERLLLSRSCSSSQGQQVVASPFLEDLIAAATHSGVPFADTLCPIEPAPDLDRAYGVEDVRRSVLRHLAAVPVGVRAQDLPSLGLPERAHLEGMPLADLLSRVAIERQRLASMLAPQAAPSDEYGGLLTSQPHAMARVEGRALGSARAPLSPSALEDMARCPFLFFTKRILGVSADRTLGDDPDALTLGSVAHLCFEAAMRALIEEGLVPYRIELADLAASRAREVAQAVAVGELATWPLDPDYVEVLCVDLVDKIGRLVRSLYEADDGYTPFALEQSFGTDDEGSWPPLELLGDTGPIHIWGRLDLVERQAETVRVVDLKTGRMASLDKRFRPSQFGKTDLQLPLYAAAARLGLGAPSMDARYLSLLSGEATKSFQERTKAARSAWRKDPRSLRDVLDTVGEDGKMSALGEHVAELAKRARSGRFEVRPAQDACDHCDYASVCRIPRGAPKGEENDA